MGGIDFPYLLGRGPCFGYLEKTGNRRVGCGGKQCHMVES